MKMVNIGYVSLIPQNLEGILEELVEGGGGSGGAGVIFTFDEDASGLLDPDGEPLTYTALVQFAATSICCIVRVNSNGVNVSYLSNAYTDGTDFGANFAYLDDGELATETFVAESADAQLVYP